MYEIIFIENKSQICSQFLIRIDDIKKMFDRANKIIDVLDIHLKNSVAENFLFSIHISTLTIFF